MGVGGGGNDKSPLPAAGAFGVPGERETRRLRAQTPHSLYPSPSLALQAIPHSPCPQGLCENSQLFPQTWFTSSSLIPLGSREIFYPESHFISTLRGISPPTLPALTISGQGAHQLRHTHFGGH